MKERLSDYFKGVASKVLSAVEIDPTISNQHELQGVNSLRQILGTSKCTFDDTTFIYLGDESASQTCSASVTWYDARERQPHRSPEYRLYYQANEVMARAEVGDLLIVGITPSGKLAVIVAEADTPPEWQLAWLFDSPRTERFKVSAETNRTEIGFAERYILAQLGLQRSQYEILSDDALSKMLNIFGERFPTTKEFSAHARASLGHSISVDPDMAIIQCFEREEALFMLLEEHIVKKRLETGFHTMDEFASFAKSWINRRYARAGYSFENHLKYIFDRENIKYSSQNTTEVNKRPDFIFPSIEAYHNAPEELVNKLVTMLAAKTSAKDRWRQVLNEAHRLQTKYLITLEPSISESQTDEMREAHLRLVVPQEVQKSYTGNQQDWILTLAQFLEVVRKRQKHGI